MQNLIHRAPNGQRKTFLSLVAEKKLFYLLTAVAAMALTACGGNGTKSADSSYRSANTVPQKLQSCRDSLMAELRRERMDDGEIYLDDMFFEGDNMVVQYVAREEELDGQSLKYFWHKMGYDSPRYIGYIKSEMISFLTIKETYLAELLHEYRYNLVWRYVGNRSRERIDIKVSYREF